MIPILALIGALLAGDIPQVISQKIAIRSDQLHAVVWSPSMGSDQLTTWHNSFRDFTTVAVPGWAYTQPECALVGNTAVIVDAVNGGAGPILAREVDLASGTESAEFSYGTSDSRVGCSTALSTGGAVFFNFVTFGIGASEYGIDVAVRSPAGWMTQRFLFPNSDPGTLTSFMDASELNGKVYLFHGFDASGRIDLKIFSVDSGIVLLDNRVNFIGRNQGDISPSTEIPLISVFPDLANQRLILAYQNVRSVAPLECIVTDGMLRLAYPRTLTAVSESLDASFLAFEPGDTFQDVFDHCLVIPRATSLLCLDGRRVGCADELVYFQLNFLGASQDGYVVPNGKLVSWSQRTGWAIFKDPSLNSPFVVSAPPSRISRFPAAVKVVGAFTLYR